MKNAFLLVSIIPLICYSQSDTTTFLVRARTDFYIYDAPSSAKPPLAKVLFNDFGYAINVPKPGFIGVLFDTLYGITSIYNVEFREGGASVLTNTSVPEKIKKAIEKKYLSKSMAVFVKDSFALEKSEAVRRDREVDSLKKIDRANRARNIMKLGIGIIEYSTLIDTYQAGIKVTFYNPSSRTVKYVHFTLDALNPVKDKIGRKTVEAIGPIESQKSATYTFDDIFISRVVDRIRPIKLEIIYMDGFKKIINEEDIYGIFFLN